MQNNTDLLSVTHQLSIQSEELTKRIIRAVASTDRTRQLCSVLKKVNSIIDQSSYGFHNIQHRVCGWITPVSVQKVPTVPIHSLLELFDGVTRPYHRAYLHEFFTNVRRLLSVIYSQLDSTNSL